MKKIKITCNNKSIKINDTVVSFPVHLNTLINIFGEPSFQEYNLLWRIAWDDLGIYCDYGTWDNILSIKLLINKTNKFKYLPKQLFDGQILINDISIFDLEFEYNIELKKHAIHKIKYKGKGETLGFSISKNFNHKEEIPKDKYLISKLKEEIIEFKDFNFKLAIIQDLMYEKELLKPKFDLYEFVDWYQERKIDIEKEGYEQILEVTQYFKDLPIPKKLATEVTEIYQDGGNEIYLQMLRFTDGTDGYFEIESKEDAQHFPNLKKVTLIFYNNQKTIDEFNAKGIKASYL